MEIVFHIAQQIKKRMKELTYRYENSKEEALKLMKAGKINAYFNTLLEMKKYKGLMIAIVSN
jgi:hypothetical protein